MTVSYTVIKIRSSNLVSTQGYSHYILWMITNKHRKVWTNELAMVNLKSQSNGLFLFSSCYFNIF